MAVTARFTADFSSFQTAVAQADVVLRGFESNAGRVEKSLNRVTDAFSGRKIIQDATLAAQAVENIGGSSRLTETELQKVAALASEAAAKLKVLGQEVPPKIQDLADQLKQTQSPLEKMAFTVGKVVGGFFAFDTVKNVLTSVVESTVQFASHLDDLSKATGINTSSLQELGFAGKRVGVDLDEMANLVGQLSKRLATGDNNAVSAVQSLGLKLEDLKKLQPQDLFVTIAEAVGRISDPMAQAGIGSELFGRKFQEVLRLSKDGLRETMQEAEQFGAVAGPDAIKTLDKFGDSVGDLTTRLKVLAAEALSPVVEWMNKILLIGQQTSKLTFIDPTSQQQLKEFGVAMGATDTAGQGLGMGLKVVGAAAEALAKGVDGPITAMGLLQNRIAAVREELSRLTPEQKAQIDSLQTLGFSQKEIAQAVGLSEAALKSYTDAQHASQAAARELAAEEKRASDEVIRGWNKQQEAIMDTYRAVDSFERKIASEQLLPFPKMGGELQQIQALFPPLTNAAHQFTKEVNEWGDGIVKTIPSLKDLGVQIPLTFGAALTDSLSILQRAFEGGGGIAGGLQSIAVMLGTKFGEVLTAAIKKAVQAGADVFNALTVKAAGATGVVAGLGVAMSGASAKAAAASAALAGVSVAAGAIGSGAAIGGAVALGAATAGIGLAAVGAYYGLKKLFTDSEKEINPLRQQFVDAAGGLDALNKEVFAATGSLKLVQDLLNAKNAQQYNAAIQALNKTLTEFEAHQKAIVDGVDAISKAAGDLGGYIPTAFQPMLDALLASGDLSDELKAKLKAITTGGTLQDTLDTAKKYGLTLDDLGGKTKQLSITTTADQTLTDFQKLIDAGADYGNTVNHFAGSVNELVQNAMKYGSSLPTALQPIAQALIDSGQLVDKNGDKIKDLSGIKFDDTGDPLAKGLKTLNDTLQDLIKVLGGDLPEAAEKGAKDIGDALGRIKVPPVHVPVVVDEPGGGGKGDTGGATAARLTTTASNVLNFSRLSGGASTSSSSASGDLVIQVDGDTLARVVNFRNNRALAGRTQVRAS